jgi:hypothetical protein
MFGWDKEVYFILETIYFLEVVLPYLYVSVRLGLEGDLKKILFLDEFECSEFLMVDGDFSLVFMFRWLSL